jgi:hypothetical protein
MGNNYRSIFGPIYQGINEQISYSFDFTALGVPGSSVDITLLVDETWVSASPCLFGSSATSGCVITTPIVRNLTSGSTYRLSCRTSIGSNIYEFYGTIIGEQ